MWQGLLHWEPGNRNMLLLLVVLKTCLVLQIMGEMVDLMVGRPLLRADTLDLGVDGLVQAAVLQLVVFRQLLRARRSWIESIVVVLLLGARRWWVLGHLRQHPVVDSALRVSGIAWCSRREVEVGHDSRGHSEGKTRW